jgi:hypothetical protein
MRLSFYRFIFSLFLMVLFIGIKPSNAQQTLEWFKTFGSPGTDVGTDVICDNNGGVYLTGTFGGPMQMGNQTLYCRGVADGLNSSDVDGFISKLDSAGNVVWAISFGSNNQDNSAHIILSKDGNLLVTGSFYDTCIFGSISVIAAGVTDMFIAKINAQTGEYMWVTTAGALGSYSQGNAICEDAGGNIIVGGNTNGYCFFGQDTIKSKGSFDFFVAKYDTTGTIIWVKDFGSNGSDDLHDISADTGKSIYICGVFSNVMQMGSTSLISNGSTDLYWAKLDATGNVLWAKSAGGPDSENSHGIKILPDGSFYLAGWTQDTIKIQNRQIDGNGVGTLFLARFNNNGNIVWAQYGYNQTFSDLINELVVDEAGNAYFTGLSNFFVPRLEEPGGRAEESEAACPFGDLIICKYDTTGNFLFMNHTLGNNLDMGYGVAADRQGNYYVTGYFTDSISYGSTWKVGNGGSDVLLLKFKDGTASVLTGVQTASPDVFQTAMYPNPVNDKAFIQLQSSVQENISVSIIDLSGRIIHQYSPYTIYPGTALMPLTLNLPSGLYLLNIKGQNHTSTLKFVVN